MSPELHEYRNHLIGAEQKSQEQYDKAVLAFSGGAFGLSVAFHDSFGGEQVEYCFLLASWVCWGISISSIVGSFFLSTVALRKAIAQLDRDEIYKQSPGAIYSTLVGVLNALGGLFLVFGMIAFSIFVTRHL